MKVRGSLRLVVAGLFGVIILCFIVFLLLLRGGSANSNGEYWITELYIDVGGVVKEVKVKYPEGYTYLFVDDEKVEEISIIPRKPHGILDIVKVDSFLGEDITKKAPISELTWEATLYDSARYLTYLESEGYKSVQTVKTPQYIETFYEKEGLIKRIVIFKDSIMVGDLVDGAGIPDPSNLLSRYLN